MTELPITDPSPVTGSPRLAGRITDGIRYSFRTKPEFYAVGLACVALAAVALWYGGRSYFRWDEWEYWTVRRDLLDAGWHVQFLFEPYGGTLPTGIMALWLPLDAVFGMHAYLPYVIPSVLFHVVAAVALFGLVRTSVRREYALASAVVFLFMGNAALGISYGWMVGYVVSLAATFVAIRGVLEFEPERRVGVIAVTFGASVVALLFSAVGLATFFVVVVAYVARRRPRLAALHGVGGGGLYLVWRALFQPGGLQLEWSEVGSYFFFVWNGLIRAGADLVQLPFASGVLVLGAAVTGAVWSYRVRDRLWVANVALLAGALFFFVLVGTRAAELNLHSFSFDQDRYLYVAGAFLLPSLIWFLDRVTRSRRGALLLVLALLWIVPANVEHQLESYRDAVELGRANRGVITTAASLAGLLDSLEDGLLVKDETARFSVEQFRRLIDEGKVPCVADHQAAQGMALGRDLGPLGPGDVVCR